MSSSAQTSWSKNIATAASSMAFQFWFSQEKSSACSAERRGKTTTFNMVVGVVRPDEGAVKFQDTDVTRKPMHCARAWA